MRFHLSASPRAIRPGQVELDDGEVLAADLVVMGVGVRPRTALAEAAGLRVQDGVVVDALMQTSAPGVFAAGDIARYPEARLGELVRIEHWAVAERQGQAAARAMLGLGRAFRDVPFFWSAHYDVTLVLRGSRRQWDAVDVRGDLAARDATHRVPAGGRAARGGHRGARSPESGDRGGAGARRSRRRGGPHAFMMETWAETTFQPRSGNRTQVWL